MKPQSLGLILITSIATAITVTAAPDHDHKPETAPATAKSDPHDDHDDHDEHGHDDHDHDSHVDEVTLTADAIRQHGVRIGTVKKQSIARAFTAPARVMLNGDAIAHIGSSVTGRVAELHAKLGDVVKKGDVLAIVESPELGEAQSDYLMKRTTIDTAKPAVKLAADALERARQLLNENQGIALAEVQKREAELRTAEAALRSAEASATAAENKLHLYGMSHDDLAALVKTGEIVPKYRLLAPISGQVIEREITLGELVNPDRDALMIIADLTTLWVIADVPEARLNGITKGTAARVSVAAHKDHPIDGAVTFIAALLDPNTRSANVRIEVKDEHAFLRPGMFAQVSLSPAAAEGEAVLAIPEEAVQTVEGSPAVFVPVEGEPNTFAKRTVTTSKPSGGWVAVHSGLKEGESLVVSGSFILKAELGKSGAAHEH